MSTTCERGTSAAPNTPCNRRAATISASEFDRPQSAEAIVALDLPGYAIAEASVKPATEARKTDF